MYTTTEHPPAEEEIPSSVICSVIAESGLKYLQYVYGESLFVGGIVHTSFTEL